MGELEEQLLEASRNGLLSLVRRLIDLGANPKYGGSLAFLLAVDRGHIEVVKFLAPLSDVTTQDSAALRLAAGRGHLNVVKFLAPMSDIHAWNSAALRWAEESKHLEVVKFLQSLTN